MFAYYIVLLCVFSGRAAESMLRRHGLRKCLFHGRPVCGLASCSDVCLYSYLLVLACVRAFCCSVVCCFACRHLTGFILCSDLEVYLCLLASLVGWAPLPEDGSPRIVPTKRHCVWNPHCRNAACYMYLAYVCFLICLHFESSRSTHPHAA